MTKKYDKAIFALALPALGTLAADPLVSLIDTAFIGRLGSVHLAALGINVALFSLAFFVFNFLAYGTTPMVGRAVGKADYHRAGQIASQALFLAALLGLLAVTVLELFATPLLSLMGAKDELLEPALNYLRIRALAGPAVLIITAANGIYRGFQDTKTPLYISLSVSAINLILDPLFIFVAGWGITGAALATLIAQWFGALVFLWFLFKRQKEQFKIPLHLPKLADLRPFLKIGWELALRTTSLILTFTLATAIASRVGIVAVAAHQVAFELWVFMALLVDALAIAAQALVARYLGESKFKEAEAVANRLLYFGLLVGAALGVLFWLARPLLTGLFTNDPEVTKAVLSIFPFIAIMQPLNALVFVWDGIFIGAEQFRYIAVAMIVSALCAACLLFLVLPLNWGLSGVWWGLILLMGSRLLSLAWRYRTRGLR